MKQLNEELLDLTKPYVGRTDQVQGPGGNTSVKNSAGQMIIKASGYRFEEINITEGYSIVNNKNIRDYFRSVQVLDKETEEKYSVQLVLQNVLQNQQGVTYPKPSMETGFHSVLNTYVIHTHSVWSNLINCNIQADVLIEGLKKALNKPIALLPYISPGFGLSYTITQVIKHAEEKNEDIPSIFFLGNHGIIAHGKTAEATQELLKQVDNYICKTLDIDSYPLTYLEKLSDTLYVPTNSYIRDLISLYHVNIEFFQNILFPDQTVFFKGNISFDTSDIRKININHKGEISYQAGYREALSIHETITAYFFIYHNIIKAGYQPRYISNEEVDYINGMDMEKHRKSLMDNIK